MKCLLFLACILIHFASAKAQYYAPENQVWAFGDSALINFSSGVPVAGTSSIYTLEGCASISNSVGELLFYTDGKTVYNRTNVIMPSGPVVPGDVYSTGQSAVIVPFLNDTNKYYLFSLSYPGIGGSTVFTLSYSIIDMSLDGGLGDIAPASANIFMADTMSEKLIAIPGNNCNIWLLAHKSDTNLFYVYEITGAGISPPAIYTEGFFNGYTGAYIYGVNYHFGAMKCSHDRNMLFLSCIQGPVPPGADRGTGELYDFNPATGVVSNCRVIATEALYAAEFSPDGTKLYVSNSQATPRIDQYDLSLSTAAAISASRTAIYSPMFGDLRLAPDGKIYTPYGDCITNPNAVGAACGFVYHAVDLAPARGFYGLPNLVWKVHGVAPTITGPSSVCVGDTITLYNAISGGVWLSDNSTIATAHIGGQIVGISAGTVSITYKVPEGQCQTVTTITVNECETALVQPRNDNSVSIYPQPANSHIIVAGGSHIKGAKFTLYDMAGRQVFTTTLSQSASRISLEGVVPGIYNGTVSDSHQVVLARKLVVKQ